MQEARCESLGCISVWLLQKNYFSLHWPYCPLSADGLFVKNKWNQVLFRAEMARREKTGHISLCCLLFGVSDRKSTLFSIRTPSRFPHEQLERRCGGFFYSAISTVSKSYRLTAPQTHHPTWLATRLKYPLKVGPWKFSNIVAQPVFTPRGHRRYYS